jgi:hypothetical protein
MSAHLTVDRFERKAVFKIEHGFTGCECMGGTEPLYICRVRGSHVLPILLHGISPSVVNPMKIKVR